MISLLKNLKLSLEIFKSLNNKDSLNTLERFEKIRRISQSLLPEYRFKWPQMEWWQDEAFNQYLAQFAALDSMNIDRHWMLYQLMRLVDSIAGDTAECGVYQEASSYLICAINANNKLYQRTHFMFDSFEGLSEPSRLDGEHWQKGDLSCPLETVKTNLAKFSHLSFHPGWIPAGFADVTSNNFAFVHIDVDLYHPTYQSLEFFYHRMTEGGIILCDDYGFASCVGATKAVEEFLQDKPEKMISLSAGGGFLIKGLPTAIPVQQF